MIMARLAVVVVVAFLTVPCSFLHAQSMGGGAGAGTDDEGPAAVGPGRGGPAARAAAPGGGGPSIANYEMETLARLNVTEDLTPYGVDLLGEQFDLATGAVSFHHTDVSIPGNSSLEVAIHRSLRTAVRRFRKTEDFVDWSLDVPSMSLIVPRSRGWSNNRCTGPLGGIEDLTEYGVTYMNYSFSNGLKLNIPGQGARAVLDNPKDPVKATGVYGTTNDYWRITCFTISGSSEGFIATSPRRTATTAPSTV